MSVTGQQILLFLSFSFIVIPAVAYDEFAQSEHALFDMLLTDYNSQLRPVKDPRTVVVVEITPIIISLIEVDEKGESIVYNQWLLMTWHDEFLRWNPQNYGNLSKISIPTSQIWIPDVVITDSRGNLLLLPLELTYAKITSDGIVTATFQQLCTIKCIFDIAEFPFDKQECTFTYGSWAFWPNELRITRKEGGMDSDYTLNNLKDNSEWIASSYEAHYKSVPFGENDSYITLAYILKLERKPEYFIMTLVTPSFLITTICLIGLFSPSNCRGEREEKVTLGLTTLLTMAVILNIVTDQMPKSSQGLPLLGRFILYEMCISSLGVCVTVLIMFIHEKALEAGWMLPHWLVCSKSLVTECHENFAKCSTAENMTGNTDESDVVKNGNTLLELECYQVRQLFNDCLSLLKCMHTKVNKQIIEENNAAVWAKFFHRIDVVLMISFVLFNTCISFSVVGSSFVFRL